MSKADVANQLVAPSDRPWGLTPASCARCKRSFLAAGPLGRCPCGAAELQRASVTAPTHGPDELAPPSLSQEDLPKRIHAHLTGGWLTDRRHSPQRLAEQARLVWWPRWLVDAQMRSNWSAELGFDYRARSSVEVMQHGSWQSVEREEDRIRWEPRAGTLDRPYKNVLVNALRRSRPLLGLAGEEIEIVPFEASRLQGGLVQLPDRDPDEVWEEVVPAFRARAAQEIALATEGDHIRDVHLDPSFSSERWSVRLHPVWWVSSGPSEPRLVLLIDGNTGRTFGPRYHSMSIAWIAAAILATLGVGALVVTFFALVIGLVLPLLWVIVPFSAILAVIFGVGAIVPPAYAWSRNARERAKIAQLP